MRTLSHDLIKPDYLIISKDPITSIQHHIKVRASSYDFEGRTEIYKA
jgi:hypothetical protein